MLKQVKRKIPLRQRDTLSGKHATVMIYLSFLFHAE